MSSFAQITGNNIYPLATSSLYFFPKKKEMKFDEEIWIRAIFPPSSATEIIVINTNNFKRRISQNELITIIMMLLLLMINSLNITFII